MANPRHRHTEPNIFTILPHIPLLSLPELLRRSAPTAPLRVARRSIQFHESLGASTSPWRVTVREQLGERPDSASSLPFPLLLASDCEPAPRPCWYPVRAGPICTGVSSASGGPRPRVRTSCTASAAVRIGGRRRTDLNSGTRIGGRDTLDLLIGVMAGRNPPAEPTSTPLPTDKHHRKQPAN